MNVDDIQHASCSLDDIDKGLIWAHKVPHIRRIDNIFSIKNHAQLLKVSVKIKAKFLIEMLKLRGNKHPIINKDLNAEECSTGKSNVWQFLVAMLNKQKCLTTRAWKYDKYTSR